MDRQCQQPEALFGDGLDGVLEGITRTVRSADVGPGDPSLWTPLLATAETVAQALQAPSLGLRARSTIWARIRRAARQRPAVVPLDHLEPLIALHPMAALRDTSF